MVWWTLGLIVAGVVVFVVLFRRSRAPSERIRVCEQEPEDRARWVRRDELRPDVAEAYERGRMSNEQMTELLRAGGWNVSLKDGKIVKDP
jgi:hypothetical protein